MLGRPGRMRQFAENGFTRIKLTNHGVIVTRASTGSPALCVFIPGRRYQTCDCVQTLLDRQKWKGVSALYNAQIFRLGGVCASKCRMHDEGDGKTPVD